MNHSDDEMDGMAFVREHYPRETPTSDKATRNGLILINSITNTTHMHISCANNCLTAAADDANFVGVCFFANDNSVHTDNGRRIRSGYIYVESDCNLSQSSTKTFHQQTMDKIFSSNLCNKAGVAIVGFAQQNGQLKGRSGTLNGELTTNLSNQGRELFFLCRSPIFGALIIFKICVAKRHHIQNICANSASIALMLFLLIRRNGNDSIKNRFPKVDIEQAATFYQELYGGLLAKCQLSPETLGSMLDKLCDNVAKGIVLSETEFDQMRREIHVSVAEKN